MAANPPIHRVSLLVGCLLPLLVASCPLALRGSPPDLSPALSSSVAVALLGAVTVPGAGRKGGAAPVKALPAGFRPEGHPGDQGTAATVGTLTGGGDTAREVAKPGCSKEKWVRCREGVE